MQLIKLSEINLDEVVSLFGDCFYDDHYYAQIFPDVSTRREEIINKFSDTINFVLKSGYCYGVKLKNELISFILCFDYTKTKTENEKQFLKIFDLNATTEENLPYYDSLHAPLSNCSASVIFLLSVAVKKTYRKKGIASALIDAILAKHPECCFAGDVSNEKSLDIYKKRDFKISTLDEKYYLVLHTPETVATDVFENDTFRLAVPETKLLETNNIPHKIIKNHHTVFGVKTAEYFENKFFEESFDSMSSAVLVEIEYQSLLAYQRVINMAQNSERLSGAILYYVLNTPYPSKLLTNGLLEEMLVNRKTEWSIIPDVYVSVPVEYQDINLIKEIDYTCSENERAFLDALNFRTVYEAGIPSSINGNNDVSNIKNRIKRYPMGKFLLKIVDEMSMDNIDSEPETIGMPAYVNCYISLDCISNCAVVTWCSLSAPFLISHYMDNTIRNQIMIYDGEQWINFFDHLQTKYRIFKKGTPKIFAKISQDRSVFSNNQLASLLFSESIYPDGESFGNIIDGELIEIISSKYGMGQYDRGHVFAHTNVVLQFDKESKAGFLYRLQEATITLFYIELLLFEEAAITIADQAIVKLYSTDSFISPTSFLKQVDRIYDNYSKTIAFWDMQVNYPSSQKSMHMLRTAFKINEQLENMSRNREQLQISFDTKCEIIDRNDTQRMDLSLAILSILTIFSALMDSHAYVAVWNNMLSEQAVSTVQSVLFFAIIITATYSISHLFGHKLVSFFKKLFRKNNKI